VERPREPGVGAARGRWGRAAGAQPPPAPPNLLPAPTHPAQPLGETRRRRVASPSDRQKLRELAAASGPPDFASSRERGRRRRGAFGAASQLPSPQRGGERPGGGRVLQKNLEPCKGIRSR
jgi:hypothetical protein